MGRNTGGVLQWVKQRSARYLDGRELNGILQDEKGAIWVTKTGQGFNVQPICRINAPDIHCYGYPTSVGAPLASAIPVAEDALGNLWIGHDTAVLRWSPESLLQTFHGLMFQFQAVRNLMPGRPDEAMRSLDDAINETEKALSESRDAIKGLRSEPIAKGDLAELLRATSQELATAAVANQGPAKQHPPAFDLIEEGERRTLSPTTENEICRIAFEILRNAFNHAHADRIEVEIRYDSHVLRLRIRDDGQGIDPKVLKEGGRAGHWGLRGLRERADRIGAQLDFWSEAGAGTEVQLAVPAAVAYESLPASVASKFFRKVRNRG